MTVSDDLYGKLANVTKQLGEERTRCEGLDSEVKRLREDLRIANQRYSDACFQLRRFKEQQGNY